MIKKALFPLLLLLLAVIAVFFTIKKPQDAPLQTMVPHPITKAASERSPDILTVKDENGKIIDLVIDTIPQYKAYLESQEDIMTEITRTQSEVLHLSTPEHFVLLKYNCGNKQCSTILVKKSDTKVTSMALAEGIFQDYKISPNKNELLLRYGYNEGGEIVRHILLAVDLSKMKVISYDSTPLAKEYMDTPTWPIVDYQWTQNDRFTIETADLESAEFDAVKHWYASHEKKTKPIEFLINKEK